MWPKPHDQGLAVERLELVEGALIDDPRDHLADLERPSQVRADDAVQLGRVVDRLGWRAQLQLRPLDPVQVGDDPAREAERVGVGERVVVADAGLAGVDVGAAEFLRAHDLAGCRFDQRRAAEKNRALLAHDDALIRHRRDVGATRGAGAHDDRDLGDPGGRHGRLVVEDPAEVLAVRKHLVLVRQIGAAGIDQVDAGQPVLAGDLLGAQMLLDRDRVVGAALDRGVVGDHQALLATDPADAGDQARGRHLVAIHAEGRELGQLEKGRAGVEQRPHPVARQQFAAAKVALARGRAAALPDQRDRGAEILDQGAHRRGIGAERLGARVDLGPEQVHGAAVRAEARLPRGRPELNEAQLGSRWETRRLQSQRPLTGMAYFTGGLTNR